MSTLQSELDANIQPSPTAEDLQQNNASNVENFRAIPSSSNGESKSHPSGLSTAPKSENAESVMPTIETVEFETGNPETRSTTQGTLDLAPISSSSSVLVVESVPGLMTSPDFCIFVRPFFDMILYIRPLRLKTERNRYIVVMKFRTSADANKFVRVYNGRHFLQGLVQETCILRDVKAIRFNKVPEKPTFPNSSMFPDEGADELLALCPVCLEPLDAPFKALVTTFCNHTMHAGCMAQWDLNRCPVCRHIHELTPEASTCMHCNNREDLWMCVVCAYVGCGVYKNKHAHAHFRETQHPFAMNLEDCTFWSGDKVPQGSVWDYVSDRFVNRLLSSDEGKVVEVVQEASRGNTGASSSSTGATCCARNEDVGIVEDEEHDRALQAAVYASRMDAVVDDYRAKLERLELEHAAEKEKVTRELERLRSEVSHLTKVRRSLQKKSSDAEKEMNSLKDKNAFLKNLNEALLRDKQGWNEEVERLKKQLADVSLEKEGLEEQLRDLMMHLEAQSRIAGSSDACRSDISELHGGDVVRVGPSPRERLAMKTSRR
ncbi:BRCA1-associated protein [Gracilariopsis chorda]|uniref:BRCA1-associated protein n=1 Tax=Gracilariopsis chorda TaxID=448386 RepID=A0A2V3J2K0_9FLOR|nr:BRCA1-associated protein [Gracilariopsis chorda]|eukprot:PXF48676.1 BRCA1-associated protein [Gracilariopsis chorda]